MPVILGVLGVVVFLEIVVLIIHDREISNLKDQLNQKQN